MQPGSGGGLTMPKDANYARPDSAAAATRIRHGLSERRMAAQGTTLSDKTARQQFGLAQDEIYDAIDAGTLQYRQACMHGNPWLRLLRREVEAPPGPSAATVTSASSRPGRS